MKEKCVTDTCKRLDESLYQRTQTRVMQDNILSFYSSINTG